jgi:putative transposase
VSAVCNVEGELALQPLCAALGVSRATVYRRRKPAVQERPRRPTPRRALAPAERNAAGEILVSDRFVDRSPAHVVHALLDEGRYLCSPRTMYRILAGRGHLRERRSQRVHPKYQRPELMASAPNEVWSWDITRLRTYVKWRYLYLYVILDIFSRFVVGWMIAEHENAALAKNLIEESIDRHGVRPGSLVLHADRGTQMTSKTLAQLLADLDVVASFSRPHVSNDNPFSESQFRTTKYEPSFPGKFTNREQALEWGRRFFPWYNHEHHHSGIAYLTPADMHCGRAGTVVDGRHRVMLEAYAAHPERFPGGPPRPLLPPTAAFINPPRQTDAAAHIQGDRRETGIVEARH